MRINIRCGVNKARQPGRVHAWLKNTRLYLLRPGVSSTQSGAPQPSGSILERKIQSSFLFALACLGVIGLLYIQTIPDDIEVGNKL
jgi:hypothetical protein